MDHLQPILPGAVIGVFGSGQLGRMLAIEARKMGYYIHVYSPESNSPTGQIADLEFVGAYDNVDKIRQFAAGVDVITYEFENVPSVAAETASAYAPVRPSGKVLFTTQNRAREKRFLELNGFPVTPSKLITKSYQLFDALAELGAPLVVKTADWGYDGKGQIKITTKEEVSAGWEALDCSEAVAESFVDFEKEVSVVAARGADGFFAHFGVIENRHVDHILDTSVYPATVSEQTRDQAIQVAKGILTKLDVIGVLCVEFFVQRDGTVLVNELAPRPHNSGHLTFDACSISQFELQLRAICGLPLTEPQYLSHAAMANVLGDLWQDGEPNWSKAVESTGVKLHLYGKEEPRPGRKMGHLTALASSGELALQKVQKARQALISA